MLKYKNAKTILPERLYKELQKYVQGEIIYVPRDNSTRARWGEKNGARKRYSDRNKEIIRLYRNGISKEEIAGKYFLSEYSIKKLFVVVRIKHMNSMKLKKLNNGNI